MNHFEEKYQEYRLSGALLTAIRGFMLLKEVVVPKNTTLRNVTEKISASNKRTVYHEHLLFVEHNSEKCDYVFTLELCVTDNEVSANNIVVHGYVQDRVRRKATDDLVAVKSQKTLCSRYRVASPSACMKVMPNIDKHREFTTLFWVKQKHKATWDIVRYEDYISVAPNVSSVCNALPLHYWIDVMISNYKIISFTEDSIFFGKDQKLEVKSPSMYAYVLGKYVASAI